MGEKLLKRPKVRILILEDVPADAELMEHEIRRVGIDAQTRIATTKDAFLKELDAFLPDIILSDYNLPSYDGLSAFKAARKKYPDMPFIMVSGALGEERTIEILKDGVTDCILKNRLFRLGLAVKRALKEAEEHGVRKQFERTLIESEKRYRLLFDLESDAIFLVNGDSGSVMDANTAASALYGYSKKELLLMRDVELSAEQEKTTEAIRNQVTHVPLRYHRKKDGTLFPVETMINHFIWQGQKLYLAAVRDITFRLKAEQVLKESERILRELINATRETLILIDTTGTILMVNEVGSERLGKNVQELTGTCLYDHFSPDIAQSRKAYFDRVAATGEPAIFEDTRKGRSYEIYCYPVADNENRVSSLAMFALDVTERKHAEELGRMEHAKFVALSENAPFGLIMINNDGAYSYMNRKFTEILGYDISDVPNGREFLRKAYPDPEYRRKVAEAWVNDTKDAGLGEQRPRVFTVRCRNGQEKIVKLISVRLDTGTTIISVEDITERIGIEERIKESEALYRTLFDSASDAIFLMKDDRFVDTNRKTLEMFQCTKEQIIGQPPYRFSPPFQPDGRDSTEKALEKIKAALSGEPQFFEWQHCRYDGTPFDTEVSLNAIRLDKGTFIHAFVRDISNRKESERKIKAAEERYRDIVEFALEGIYQTTPEGRPLMVNRAYSLMLGYGSPREFLAAVANARQIYVHSEERDKLVDILEREGSATGFETELYSKNGSKIWVLINVRVVKDSAGKALYYEGTMEDITKRRNAELSLTQNMEKLRRAMGEIINVIVTTIESRDPYTSGHQKRVANLARAIATEMGLSSEQIDGIRMAGVIHDLGKISVPAEILSKPSRLTDAEFSLIKQHPTIGYHILKDVEFSWPIADIVYQHHERMNGSGYPRGLKEDEIIPEARIIAVADVVESMASHRPYRAAFGVDTALEEITRNRGILYDDRAVNACVKLFKEKEFVFG